MTTIEKLDVIVKDIRQKLPRLMELEEGCWVNRYGEQGIIIEVNKESYNTLVANQSVYHNLKNATKQDEIIGKEPMLNDMLEWVKILKYFEDNRFKKLYIDCNGYFYIRDYDTEHQTLEDIPEYIKWDLSKPYLKDQSEELIDFLYSLLKI